LKPIACFDMGFTANIRKFLALLPAQTPGTAVLCHLFKPLDPPSWAPGCCTKPVQLQATPGKPGGALVEQVMHPCDMAAKAI